MSLAVAVLTLTRDRLAYTSHCFSMLEKNAGCEYDHFVLDQGSEDGTQDWLADYNPTCLVLEDENIGICRGMNKLLGLAFEQDDYDVIVKFDNDCELVQENTLRDVCHLADTGVILSPRIIGLRNPPAVMRELACEGETILDIPQIGGIFMAVPGWWYQDFRYDETGRLHGFDDVEICQAWRQAGGTCGYVKRLEAWHYLSTDGQEADDPDYWARKTRELAEA